MGKVSEYDGLGLVDVNDTIRVMGCEVNRCTELSVSAVAGDPGGHGGKSL